MTWLITNIIAAFLLPPLNLLLVGLLGVWWCGRKRRAALGKGLLIASLLGLWTLSTPYVANHLLGLLSPAWQPLSAEQADAIVILGGGTYTSAPEYGGATVGRLTLERVRYGAWLARHTGQPILVSGGSIDNRPAEAKLMRAVLEGEYGIPVRWAEDRSTNTRENARDSAALLKAAGITRIFLVSHAWHLPRAIPEFQREGLTVIPAGTIYSTPTPTGPLDFLPSAKALLDSSQALHEMIGMVWYRIRS